MSSTPMLVNQLTVSGWTRLVSGGTSLESISQALLNAAKSLGKIAPGRGGAQVEEVVPEPVETARPGSLSSHYGLNPLPLHTDTAHWIMPCRYLALACVRTGPSPTPTILLDSRKATLSASERMACRSAVFSVRNGRGSFYGMIAERDRPFIRLDPGCMTPLSSEGTMALAAFDIERHADALEAHDWSVGDILVFDNWRFLHARGYRAATDRGRVLLRAMVR
jgi:L-asparagine oxygenase